MIVTEAGRIFLRGGKTRIHSELVFKKHLLYSFILEEMGGAEDDDD